MNVRQSVFIPRLALLAAVLVAAPPPLLAQDVVALTFEGWDRRETPGGVVAFRCASPRCPPGAEVSYKRQPHRPTVGMAQFEAHHTRLARNAPANSSGRIIEARITGFSERTVEGVRVLSGRREVAWSDGSGNAAIDALLIGPAASFSVVSEAGDLKTAEAVFSHFLPRLVDLVLVSR